MLSWYEVREHSDGVDFQLRTPGGVLLLTSPRLGSVELAVRQIKELQRVVADPICCERRTNERWEPYFSMTLRRRGEDIATSPVFASSVSREHAIEATRIYARTEDVRAVPLNSSAIVGFP